MLLTNARLRKKLESIIFHCFGKKPFCSLNSHTLPTPLKCPVNLALHISAFIISKDEHPYTSVKVIISVSHRYLPQEAETYRSPFPNVYAQ